MSATQDPYDRLLLAARADCWCATYRKPCEYHEGYAVGLEAMQAALAPAAAVIGEAEYTG